MMMGGWWIVTIIIILIFIILILFSLSFNEKNEEENPLSILDKRYANGEIDDEEYLRKKKLLKSKRLK